MLNKKCEVTEILREIRTWLTELTTNSLTVTTKQGESHLRCRGSDGKKWRITSQQKKRIYGLGSQASCYYASSSTEPSNAQSIPIDNLDELVTIISMLYTYM